MDVAAVRVGPNYRPRKRGTAPMKPWLVASIGGL